MSLVALPGHVVRDAVSVSLWLFMYSVVLANPHREPQLIVVSPSSQISFMRPLTTLSQCVTGRWIAPVPSGPAPETCHFVFQNGDCVVESASGMRSRNTIAPPTPVAGSLSTVMFAGLPKERWRPERKPSRIRMPPV